MVLYDFSYFVKQIPIKLVLIVYFLFQNQSSPTTNNTPSKKTMKGGKSALIGAGVKSGCRCGNATAFPGKLTCCGQRCACYTDNKPCVDCKCRGCRNPHIADGQKVSTILSLLSSGYN